VNRRPRVLITDAEERGALAASRGLQSAGYDVGAAASRRLAVGHWSRSCSERVRLPDPREDPRTYVERLAREVNRGTYDVVLPGSEASLIPISEHREVLEPHVLLGLPTHETVLRSMDKTLLLTEAASAGLAPPPSLVCVSVEQASAAAQELGYPVVVKPHRSFAEHDGHLRQTAARVVSDEPALARAVALFGTPLVVQHHIARANVLFFAAVRIGERLHGATAARNGRTWPPDAGSAAMALTIDPPQGIEARVQDVLSRIGWSGIFQLQFLDLGGGRLATIDLNPRLFASLAIAVRAGANLPALWCDHLLGRQLPMTGGARAGIRYRWEEGELKYTIRQALSGELRAALSVLRPYRRVVHAHFELKDPAPFMVQGLALAVDTLRKTGPYSWEPASPREEEASRVTSAEDDESRFRARPSPRPPTGPLRVLLVTNMYPTEEEPWYGCFVREQAEDLMALGFDLEVLHFDGRRAPLNYLRTARDIRKRVSRESFDVIHAHYGLTGAAASAQRRVPTVTTFHGSDCNGAVPWQRWVSWAVARCSYPIFVSEEGRRMLARPSAPIIPAGVDTDLFKPIDRREARRQLGWEEDARYALLPGSRANAGKRAALFDAVVTEVQRTIPALKPIILEGLSREQTANVFNAVDVTLMTSNREGSPVTVRESLACMTPVVSVDVGDVPKVLAGLPGCGIFPSESKALARGVLAALEAGRQLALRRRAERYSRRLAAERLAVLYVAVAGPGSA
jgi:predicted ATP-grasp superfamily ATP-dependent carboligase